MPNIGVRIASITIADPLFFLLFNVVSSLGLSIVTKFNTQIIPNGTFVITAKNVELIDFLLSKYESIIKIAIRAKKTINANINPNC